MYRKERLLVNFNTNNGVERQNESFKYSYLQRYKNSSLTGIVTILIGDFFLDRFQRLVYNLNNQAPNIWKQITQNFKGN